MSGRNIHTSRKDSRVQPFYHFEPSLSWHTHFPPTSAINACRWHLGHSPLWDAIGKLSLRTFFASQLKEWWVRSRKKMRINYQMYGTSSDPIYLLHFLCVRHIDGVTTANR